MEIRRLLHRLCIVAAIAMVVAALTYRGEAQGNEKNDRTADEKSHSQQQSFSQEELAGRSARLLQQEREARLQSR